MAKSGATFISAFLLYFISRPISKIQWIAIILQLSGLIITQYDACHGGAAHSTTSYFLMAFSLLLTSVCGVWNDHIIKNYKVSVRIFQ